jgi:hypothetical protein
MSGIVALPLEQFDRRSRVLRSVRRELFLGALALYR